MKILAKYYKIQALKGINHTSATLLLPFKAVKRLQIRLVKKLRGSMIDGLGLYHRPLLASYPRSGTNWIRYIVEYISGCPTPGQRRLFEGRNYYIDRAHRAYCVMNLYQQVVLVIRDYRECLLSHHKDIWWNYPNPESFLTDEEIRHPANWYIRNIEVFDAFQGEKLLIYYEDLLDNPHEIIERLSTFLALDQNKTHLFLEDIDTHFQESVNSYTQGGHSSETSFTKDQRFHAKTQLTPDQVKNFDEFYFTRYPDLASQYLSRYDTRNQ